MHVCVLAALRRRRSIAWQLLLAGHPSKAAQLYLQRCWVAAHAPQDTRNRIATVYGADNSATHSTAQQDPKNFNPTLDLRVPQAISQGILGPEDLLIQVHVP